MSLRNTFRSMVLVGTLAACATIASAQQGPQRNSNNSSSQLNLSANAQTALLLDISTGTGGAAVTGTTGRNSTGVFTLDLGDVNALGLGTPAAGVSVDVQAGGALYTTPITLTPKFAGYSAGATADIVVNVDVPNGNANGNAAVREGASAATVSAPPVVANPFSPAVTGAANNTPIQRFVGMFVTNANGGTAEAGSLQSRLVYQILVN